jgi:hypothetical protein
MISYGHPVMYPDQLSLRLFLFVLDQMCRPSLFGSRVIDIGFVNTGSFFTLMLWDMAWLATCQGTPTCCLFASPHVNLHQFIVAITNREAPPLASPWSSLPHKLSI